MGDKQVKLKQSNAMQCQARITHTALTVAVIDIKPYITPYMKQDTICQATYQAIFTLHPLQSHLLLHAAVSCLTHDGLHELQCPLPQHSLFINGYY